MPLININIPLEFEILACEGDFIKEGQVIAQTSKSKHLEIPLHNLLDVDINKIGKYLVIKEGEKIKKGQIIAQKKELFSSTQVKSPQSGVLRILKDKPGFIQIQPLNIVGIACPVSGITGKAVEQTVIIETDSNVVFGINGGNSVSGVLFFLEEGTKIFSIDQSVSEKIVVGKGLTEAQTAKIKAIGGLGVISDCKINNIRLPFLVLESVDEIEGFEGRKARIWNSLDNHCLIV